MLYGIFPLPLCDSTESTHPIEGCHFILFFLSVGIEGRRDHVRVAHFSRRRQSVYRIRPVFPGHVSIDSSHSDDLQLPIFNRVTLESPGVMRRNSKLLITNYYWLSRLCCHFDFPSLLSPADIDATIGSSFTFFPAPACADHPAYIALARPPADRPYLCVTPWGGSVL